MDPAGEGETSEGFEMKVWLVWLKREARLRSRFVSCPGPWPEGDVVNLALGAILKTYSWARPLYERYRVIVIWHKKWAWRLMDKRNNWRASKAEGAKTATCRIERASGKPSGKIKDKKKRRRKSQ